MAMLISTDRETLVPNLSEARQVIKHDIECNPTDVNVMLYEYRVTITSKYNLVSKYNVFFFFLLIFLCFIMVNGLIIFKSYETEP